MIKLGPFTILSLYSFPSKFLNRKLDEIEKTTNLIVKSQNAHLINSFTDPRRITRSAVYKEELSIRRPTSLSMLTAGYISSNERTVQKIVS